VSRWPASAPKLFVGVANPAENPVTSAVGRCGLPSLVSAGALFRETTRFGPLPVGLWRTHGAALDSSGFVAMARFGGYRWDVSEYVEFVVRGAVSDTDERHEDLAGLFPWSWWAQMDFAAEAEIAHDRAEVEERMRLTLGTYALCRDEVDYWREEEGVTWITDPMPVLQGRHPRDYLLSLDLLERYLEGRGEGLPELVGVGSVCRRDVCGPEGLLEVVGALDGRLRGSGTRLHLFGVKGEALPHMDPAVVASVDSMAYDLASRRCAARRRIANTNWHKAAHLLQWVRRQRP